MNTESLEEQIRRLTAIETIKKLKAQYCAYCDNQYDPDGLASLFVENAIWDGGDEFGRHEGRKAIREFFSGVSGNILFAAHLVMNPIIEVSGERATGKWRLIMPCTVADSNGVAEAKWLLSHYDEEYSFSDNCWLFNKMIVSSQFYSNHLEGWAKDTSSSN